MSGIAVQPCGRSRAPHYTLQLPHCHCTPWIPSLRINVSSRCCTAHVFTIPHCCTEHEMLQATTSTTAQVQLAGTGRGDGMGWDDGTRTGTRRDKRTRNERRGRKEDEGRQMRWMNETGHETIWMRQCKKMDKTDKTNGWGARPADEKSDQSHETRPAVRERGERTRNETSGRDTRRQWSVPVARRGDERMSMLSLSRLIWILIRRDPRSARGVRATSKIGLQDRRRRRRRRRVAIGRQNTKVTSRSLAF